MHRDVRGVGDQPPFAVKERAGEIEPFADVDRDRAALQGDAHLFGQILKTAAEQLQLDGVRFGAGNRDCFRRRRSLQSEGSICQATGLPVPGQIDRIQFGDDQRRSADLLRSFDFPAQIKSGILCTIASTKPPGLRGARFARIVCLPQRWPLQMFWRFTQLPLQLQAVHLDRALVMVKTKEATMFFAEGVGHGRGLAPGHRQT